jgi:hypothetical protein
MSSSDDVLPDEQGAEEAVEMGEGLAGVDEGASEHNGEPGEEPEEETLSEEEVRVRKTLGDLQSHVTAGFGDIGGDNAVVLIVASTQRGNPIPMFHRKVPGTSLHHVKGCENCVTMAYHALLSCFMTCCGQRGRMMTICAMSAKKYDALKPDSKTNWIHLMENGAVKADGYWASAKDLKLAVYTGTNSLLLPHHNALHTIVKRVKYLLLLMLSAEPRRSICRLGCMRYRISNLGARWSA